MAAGAPARQGERRLAQRPYGRRLSRGQRQDSPRRQSLALLSEAQAWFGRRLSRSLRRVGSPDAETPRTNNVCERGFREWRRRTRPLDGFGSVRGLNNFMTLWMLKENARSLKLGWMELLMP